MKKNNLLFGIIVTVFIMFVFSSIFVSLTNRKRSEFVKYWYFKRNLERVNLAVLLYAEEHNKIMPSASSWADLIKEDNQLILKEDFVTPMSYSYFGLYYNKSLENKSLSNLKKDTIVLFTAKGEWDSNGDTKIFCKKSVNEKHSYVITINGDIYKYNPDANIFRGLKDNRVIDFSNLYWE